MTVGGSISSICIKIRLYDIRNLWKSNITKFILIAGRAFGKGALKGKFIITKTCGYTENDIKLMCQSR